MANRSDIMLFTGTAHPELANEISEILQIPLGKCNVGKFSDGEISVNINETVRGKDAFIIQPTGNPVNDNLMELCIMIDALKRASVGHINLGSASPSQHRITTTTRGMHHSRNWNLGSSH